jgi:PAS domain S-box-containing protein
MNSVAAVNGGDVRSEASRDIGVMRHAEAVRRRARCQIAATLCAGFYFVLTLWLLIILAFEPERPTAVLNSREMAIGVIATVFLCGLMTLLVLEIRHRADREVKLVDERARLDAEIQHGSLTRDQLQASETRLRDFAEMASDWFWEQDADLRFTMVSNDTPIMRRPGDRSHLGRRRTEINDTTQAPEQWAAHERTLEAREKFRDFRFGRIGGDGQMHQVSISGAPIRDAAGQFAGYRGTGRDVTAEVAAEEELRAAKNRAEQAETLLRDALGSMSEGFVIFDRDDCFVMCNEVYRQTFPRANDLLVPGMLFEDIVRTAVARGFRFDADGDQEWLTERLRQHREADGASEQRMDNGSWILATDRRMSNGGIAGLRIDITALKQAQAALRESEARLERAQAIAGVGSWELDLITGRYIWSKELYRIRGVSSETFEPTLASVEAHVHPDDNQQAKEWIASLAAGFRMDPQETRIIRLDGEARLLRVEGQAVIDPDGVIRRLAGTTRDITERRLIERQLTQAQKMEAIGNLTGGMAHDFNNGLGVIIGNLDLLGRLVEPNRTAVEICDEARDAALRCADLTRGLLAFARRQPLHPQRTDVNALVTNIARLLGRTLGEDISIRLRLDASLWPAIADPAQLEAALVNLATNARDAMPKGGQLDISTKNVDLDATYAALQPEVSPGAFVVIEITDTGVGIPPEIIGRIFEPFFTTKGPGEGSGLGLSMTFGFVKQSGGHLSVYSEPNLGTTFRLYLPRADARNAVPVGVAAVPSIVGGTDTVLVVEDNPRLRQVTARQLSELGYKVKEAEHAESALALLARDDRVDLLFTDIVMPGIMDGLDLAHAAISQRPHLKVLLTSGFPGVRGGSQRLTKCPFPLLNKPYRRDELAGTIRDVLESEHHQSVVRETSEQEHA